MYYVNVTLDDMRTSCIQMLEQYDLWVVNSDIYTLFTNKDDVNKLYDSVCRSNQFLDVNIIEVTLKEDESSIIYNYILNNLSLSDAKLSDEYSYNSIVLCIIDAIYSIGVNYTSVKNVIDNYTSKFKVKKFSKDKISNNEIEHTIEDFLNIIRGKSYDEIASEIFKNRQRTSSINGILKAKAVCEFATVLFTNGINQLDDINKLNSSIESELKKIKGQGSGVSISYFKMLCGNDNLIKPDRHILNFIYKITGENVSVDKAQDIFDNCVIKLKNIYPQISARLLDHIIWQHMSQKN